MEQVIVLDSSRQDIGLFTRNPTPGDEQVLVDRFIEYYTSEFKRRNKKNRLAVFIEPRIDSGFPDIVFAAFLPSILDNWSDKRERLDIIDIKLLSFLAEVNVICGTKLISKLGYPEKQTIKSLEKLLDAKLIIYRSNGWHIRKKSDIFSITKLVAVEAKLSDIRKVVDQTFLNTRFASHSYAVLNSHNPRSGTLQTFSKHGVGLYGKGHPFKKHVEAKRYALPSCYVSYQFNEWICKAIAH